MRVCLVSYEYPPETADGGIGTQTWNKAHGLTKLGHQVAVLSCSGRGSDLPLRSSDESGVLVHRMRRPGEDPGARMALYGPIPFMLGYTWSVLESLHRLRAETSFDLINFPEYGAEGLAFLANRTEHNWVPAIVQLHAPLAMLAERIGWPDRESTHYRAAAVLEGESIRLADGWMASSANIADWVTGFYGIPRSRIEVVHCGVDCDLFRPAEERAAAGARPTVLFVGNIAASKGIDTVFRAVLRLRERFPGILLRVVGKENELKRRLATEAERVGASHHVEWVPFVKERAAIAALYREGDVFAATADNENGVANVYVEAMASGCPIVAGNNGGTPEAVDDGVSGLLVPPNDVEATVSALARLLENDELRRQMGTQARRRAVDYFAQDRYIQRVLSAYGHAIEQSRDKVARLSAEGAP
jgi:glycosyltransferase involved in cell wall biosynthesis